MPYPKAVVALTGARDRYQLPLALFEGDLLDACVTDFYWPADQPWFVHSLGNIIPDNMIAKRFSPALGSTRISVSHRAFLVGLVNRVRPGSLSLRHFDHSVSATAKRIAQRHNAALFCYNFQAVKAFAPGPDQPPYRFVFAVQAHPLSSQRLLLEEIDRNPQAKSSLAHSPEMIQPELFQEYMTSYTLANGWAVSSSYAKQTLIANDIPADRIHVIPYGVNASIFKLRPSAKSALDPFTVIFVGSIIHRKGVSYLLDALRLLHSQHVRLILYSGHTVHEEVLNGYDNVNVSVKLGLSQNSLAQELANADVLVFPSLDEGFGLVVLEGMACGLPVIATDHTCGPDVIEDGKHGFIVPIRSHEAIAEKLQWGIDHRAELAEMGQAAAEQARTFTWERFRAGVREAYYNMVDAVDEMGR